MRKPRKLRHGARYHVICKINRGEFALEDTQFKRLYLAVLKRAMKKFSFRIENFCIMDNHVHMIIIPLENESLSKIMQWISSVFAIHHNKILKIKGHVWYDRFKSKIIDDIRQLIDTFRYITNNPVAAGIVSHPFLFIFNGINYIRKKKFDVISPPPECLKQLIQQFEQDWDKQK